MTPLKVSGALANFAVAVLAAAGILLGSRVAWGVGALFSIASIAMYVISRSIGLPGQSDEQWLEWSGVVAVTSEAIALVATVVGFRVLRATRAAISPVPPRSVVGATASMEAPPAASGRSAS